jgi:hypothetical protein
VPPINWSILNIPRHAAQVERVLLLSLIWMTFRQLIQYTLFYTRHNIQLSFCEMNDFSSDYTADVTRRPETLTRHVYIVKKKKKRKGLEVLTPSLSNVCKRVCENELWLETSQVKNINFGSFHLIVAMVFFNSSSVEERIISWFRVQIQVEQQFFYNYPRLDCAKNLTIMNFVTN